MDQPNTIFRNFSTDNFVNSNNPVYMCKWPKHDKDWIAIDLPMNGAKSWCCRLLQMEAMPTNKTPVFSTVAAVQIDFLVINATTLKPLTTMGLNCMKQCWEYKNNWKMYKQVIFF